VVLATQEEEEEEVVMKLSTSAALPGRIFSFYF